MRQLTYAQAIHEAIDQLMEKDPRVFIIGEGVPDPKGIFGTTYGLQKKYGKERVMDMPLSENALTGVCIGAALRGLRPILTHQRIDFSLLSFDQIVNVAAKWYYMFGGQQSVPIVIRMIIGRGWGQGAQHSQSLQAVYAHIPGLSVVMPATPFDAKGMLIAAVEDANPVIFIEHRWLFNIEGNVPKRYYTLTLDESKVLKKGKDITVLATSHMVIEAIKAAKILESEGVSVEVIDGRCIKPFDRKTVITSVKKTGRLLVADTGYRSFGVAAEVIAIVAESLLEKLKAPPQRVTLPDLPTSTSFKEAEKYYPTHFTIVEKSLSMLEVTKDKIKQILNKHKPKKKIPSDVPDLSFTGPF